MSRTSPTARSLARGAAWNQLGQLLPVLAALLLVPPLVHGLGVERFGILSLAWMLIGYFTLFDLGVSGALTRLVAERLASGRDEEVPSLVWTALTLTLGMGALGGIVLAALAPWLVSHGLKVPPELQDETRGMMTILAASLPVVTTTAALGGVLAARQRFGLLNAIRVPMGILTYAGPLLVLGVTRRLDAVALALAALRLAGGVAHFVACMVTVPALRGGFRFRRTLLRPIVSFGGWMSVTAVIGPVMVYLDRFLIGAMYSMAMVAYYTTPYDLASRMAILAVPIVNVLFPAFAAGFDSDRARTARLLSWGVSGAAMLLFPVALILAVFPREVLTIWLGASFAARSAAVLRLLAIGTFANGIAQVALGFLQGSGRPDLGARLHAIELPLYLGLLWVLLRSRGIEGAALAWLARVVVDAAVLFALSIRRLGHDGAQVRGATLGGGIGLIALAAGGMFGPLPVRIGFAVLALAIFAVLAWRHVAGPGVRSLLRSEEGASAA